jgi:DNA-binding response OmpR family regulator
MKILIVDTDRDLVETLTNWLKTLGYEVYRSYTGERAKIEWEERQPDLVILDTSLRDVDARQICREMRGKHDALVVVTTDDQDPQHEVTWLEYAADDYLRKPYSHTILLAHIHALTRRGRFTRTSIITVGPISIDPMRHEVSVAGKTSRLTPTEFRTLHFLVMNANEVYTANQISSHVYGPNFDEDNVLVKFHIRRIRHRIEPDPNNPTYLRTVPGAGYKLEVPDGD